MQMSKSDTPAAVRVEPSFRLASDAQRQAEKQFAKRLAKAGWHTYRDEESGRVVTNAYEDERMKLQKISGLACEVVSPAAAEGTCKRIGPRFERA
jgi:hypothetical protein